MHQPTDRHTYRRDDVSTYRLARGMYRPIYRSANKTMCRPTERFKIDDEWYGRSAPIFPEVPLSTDRQQQCTDRYTDRPTARVPTDGTIHQKWRRMLLSGRGAATFSEALHSIHDLCFSTPKTDSDKRKCCERGKSAPRPKKNMPGIYASLVRRHISNTRFTEEHERRSLRQVSHLWRKAF